MVRLVAFAVAPLLALLAATGAAATVSGSASLAFFATIYEDGATAATTTAPATAPNFTAYSSMLPGSLVVVAFFHLILPAALPAFAMLHSVALTPALAAVSLPSGWALAVFFAPIAPAPIVAAIAAASMAILALAPISAMAG